MVKIINAFRGADPLAKTIADFGNRLWGDQLTPAVKREQLRALQRENTETELLAGEYANYGTPDYDPRRVAQRATLSGDTDYANRERFLAANTGSDMSAVSRAMLGAGQAMSSTPSGFTQNLAEQARQADAGLREQQRQFDMAPKPVLGPQGPQYVPQSQMTQPGIQPVLSDTERKGTLAGQNWQNLDQLGPEQKAYLGAGPASAPNRTPRNYVGPDRRTYVTYDGVTDAQSGLPLPQGGALVGLEDTMQGAGLTNSTLSGVQQDQMSLQRFNGLLDMADQMTGDPTLFGPVGKLRGMGQEMAQTFGAVGQVFGADTGTAIQSAQQDLAQSGVNPALLPELFNYDPNIPKVETLWGLMVYQGAAALAGQQGRSVSDKDVQFFRRILGEPQSFFSSAVEAKARIGAAREIANLYSGFNANALGGAPQQQPTGAGAPAAAAPPAAQAMPQQPVVRFERGPDGVLRRVQQ